jgi:hypothetical protein
MFDNRGSAAPGRTPEAQKIHEVMDEDPFLTMDYEAKVLEPLKQHVLVL